MAGARSILLLLLLAVAAASVAPLASADCHSSWYGCTPCPTDDPCGLTDLIGTVAGILVGGDAEDGEPEDDPQLAAAVAQAQAQGGRAGHVRLHFEWEDANATSDPVPLRVLFTGNVDWPGATQDNFTFDGDEERAYEFTIRGAGHRHIPFRIMAHPDTPQAEMLEGVFTISHPASNPGAPWPLAAGLVALAAIAWLRRR